MSTVYPRVCGGTVSESDPAFYGCGLSPRVRGNPVGRPSRQPRHGSIPACAGEPCHRRPRHLEHWVYPRVCGGTSVVSLGRWNSRGLSPRVRGNQYFRCNDDTIDGSIPACAGEPRNSAVRAIVHKVYPRVCGGTSSLPSHEMTPGGLSPRVRGNRSASVEALEITGSIPACAGEPSTTLLTAHGLLVYPRVCGGTHTTAASAQGANGLSPRVRGNLERIAGQYRCVGSIPACAGEPAHCLIGISLRTVYPRVCGGTRGGLTFGETDMGLSPRVRGNLYGKLKEIRNQRSIPACAGEPGIRRYQF